MVCFEPENKLYSYSKADGIADKNVYPIYEDRAFDLVGATGGFSKFENGAFTLIKSAENFLVNAIAEDAAGRILISNFWRAIRSGK